MSSVLSHAEIPLSTEVNDREIPVTPVSVVPRSELAKLPIWKSAFASLRKDRRYYEIVEDTICPDFRYSYFAIHDRDGAPRSIQPFFVLDQDLLVGLGSRALKIAHVIRKLWPRFLVMRSLMVGCAAGEAHLQATGEPARRRDAELLSADIVRLAKEQKACLVVLKEFPSQYRRALSCFLSRGFSRIPSMPMTRLNIAYENFDDYMAKALTGNTRKQLRKKFRVTEQAGPIELEIVADASHAVDEIYPLYLQVFEKSNFHFEKLSKAYFREIGQRMPDKARFFLWRQNGKLIAFALCLMEGETLYGEYLGLDYSMALRIHLYFYMMRDIIGWAIENGFTSIVSSSLGYAPKLHMRHVLEPLDVYVRHTSPLINAVMKRVLPWLEPTRAEKTLKEFPNYDALWAKPG